MEDSLAARCWNTHYILTRVALESIGSQALRRSIPVVKLEDFLAKVKDALPYIVKNYRHKISSKSGVPAQDYAEPILSDNGFSQALMLNPRIPFYYVRALSPSEIDPKTPHTMSRQGPPGGMYVPTSEGEEIKIIDLISTYSDEPDWGMDQNLFPIESYGYGPCPFGFPTGSSSQAPFHMAFFHEGRFLSAVMPGIKKSFMEDRIKIFLELGKLALRHKVEYWGWRFVSWAIHYFQDLTQPYHAKPFPVPVSPILKRFLTNPWLKGFLEKNKNYLTNRHILFEAAVHFDLNRALKGANYHPFLKSLADNGNWRCFNGSINQIMREISLSATHVARGTDRALMSLLKEPKISRSDWILEEDENFKIEETFPAAVQERPDAYEELIRKVNVCLQEAGKITRYLLMAILRD